MLFSIAVFGLVLRTCSAVFADEAWALDWHYALLGEPQESTTFFHRPSIDSRASLIYTLSHQHTIGALNPKDGSIVWRAQIGSSNDTYLRAAEGSDIVVSGSGKLVTGRSAADGKLVWKYTAANLLKDVEMYEFGNEKDAIILHGNTGATVERIDSTTGSSKWRYGAENADLPYQVSVSATAVYIVQLHKTMLGYIKIKVITLDPATGAKKDEYALSSESELASTDNILTVGANSASPIVAWTDAAYTTIKVNVLGSKAISTFSIKAPSGAAVETVRLHAPFHANSLAHFLIHYTTKEDNWAEVFHVDLKSSKVASAYKLPSLRDPSTFSTSTVDANVYFTRISKHQISVVSSASHGVLGKWELSNRLSSFVKDTAPEFAVTEVSLKSGSVSAIRSAVWLSCGELVLLRDGSRVWQRPEALVDTVEAWFVLPEAATRLGKAVAAPQQGNIITSFIQRLQKHVLKLTQTLNPGPFSVISSLLYTESSASAFGFDKDIVCKTGKGKTYTLDTSHAGRVRYCCTDLNETQIAKVFPDSAATTDIAAIEFKRSGDQLEAYAVDKPDKPIWTFLPRQGDKILDVVPRPQEDPVASIGIVLGNRKVLYKYLNKNIALITTANHQTGSLTASLIDTVSGDLLHASTHPDVDLSLPISTILAENWFAYSFSVESSATSAKGAQLVSGELYESLSADDRGLLDASTNHSSLADIINPFVLTQVYHIAESISELSVTRTRQSITTRQLLAVLPESNSIVGIPRAAIDPRRPTRDPTKEEQMEGLVRYQPNLEFDPKWYLNHKRELLGIKDVIASPALLESTSVIFAYGHDIFGTRLSPSFNFDMLGKDFNKVQMLATVFGLAFATVAVAPLVARKQVNARWSLHT